MGTGKKSHVTTKESEDEDEKEFVNKITLCVGDDNAIGVYGTHAKTSKEIIESGKAPKNLFDDIADEVIKDMKFDAFPRFLRSNYYKDYIRCKYFETIPVNQSDFTTVRLLGRGAFGMVNASRKNNSGKLYACKMIHKGQVQAQDCVKNIVQERNILSVVRSRFVINLKFATEDKDHLYLYLDLCVGGDLKYHLNNETVFNEAKTKFYAAEVLLGLEAMHQQNIIYRDLKPENILLDKGHCRISDLGLAVQTTQPLKGYAGTPGYSAPEVCAHKCYGHASDLFAIGVMIYRFLTGLKPFQGSRGSEIDENVMYIEPDYDRPEISAECADLIQGLLIKDPHKRLGAGKKGVQEIKDHPWFNDIDWGLLEEGCIDPPFVPSRDRIHTDSVADIGHFDEGKYKKVKLSEEFLTEIQRFPYQSWVALQEELHSLLDARDKLNQKKKNIKITNVAADVAAGISTKCCSIL